MSGVSKVFFRQLFDRQSCTYTYLIGELMTKQAILIDPVDRLMERDLRLVSENGLKLRKVLNTHAHADHISSSGMIKQSMNGVISIIGKASGAKADLLVSHRERIEIGNGVSLEVLETPGHTSGCVSYYLEGEGERPGRVFTGDALFVRGCGRTDFQGGSSEALFNSVRNVLFQLPKDTVVYPAHDYNGMTCSTIAEEMEFNPRLKMDNKYGEFEDIMAKLQLKYPSMMDVALPANLNCGLPPL